MIGALRVKLKQPTEREIHHNLETSTADPLKYKMGNPILIVISVCMEKIHQNTKYYGLKPLIFIRSRFKQILDLFLNPFQISTLLYISYDVCVVS